MDRIYTTFRNLTLFIIGLSSFADVSLAQCPEVLQTQAAVNSYPAGCTAISNLTVIGSEIINLNGLSHITSVSGKLEISNTQIVSLAGLSNLTTAQNITIQGNTLLGELTGLGGLASVANVFNINTNPLIEDFTGLSSLSTFGTLYVFGNSVLANFSGLTSLAATNGSISLTNNGSLKSFTGLENLEKLTSLSTNGDPLESFTGLDNVTSIKFLTIFNTTALPNFKGLGSMESTDYMTVSGNASLVNFMGLESFTTVNNNFTIENNSALAGLCGLDELATVTGKLSITDNGALVNLVGLGKLKDIKGGLSVTGNGNLTSFTGLGDNTVSSCPSPVRMGAPTARTSAVLSLQGDLTIQNNASLTDCAVGLIGDYITQSTTETITISNNAPAGDCNSEEDIVNALPVTLADFGGSAEKDGILLHWSTESESGSDHFEIQHSRNAKAWEEIGRIAAIGNSQSTSYYSFEHKNLVDAIHYYRLKNVDSDGSFAYSYIVKVRLLKSPQTGNIYPNPVQNRVYLTEPSKILGVRLYNSDGKKVREFQNGFTNGIDVNDFASGIYLMRVTKLDGSVVTQKLAIQ